jgi:hypothetical protein
VDNFVEGSQVDEYPTRMVRIEGVTARAFQRAPAEFTSVHSAEDADRALGDDGNEHNCPLCHQFFGTRAFKAHAPDCIKARAPAWERQRDKAPPYAQIKRFGRRLIIPGHDPAGG